LRVHRTVVPIHATGPSTNLPQHAIGGVQLEHLHVEAVGLEPELEGPAGLVWPLVSVAHQPDRPSIVVKAAYTSSSDAVRSHSMENA
jgi:hypothetical protein